MIHKRILVLGPFPINNPQHGGQKRMAAIVQHYQTLFKEVRSISVFSKNAYPEGGPEDLFIEHAPIAEKVANEPHAAELVSGEAIFADIHIKNRLSHILTEYQPDIVHVEQVYLYAGLEKLLADISLTPMLIFSSHNIEHQLKDDILRGQAISQGRRGYYVNKVRRLEERFSQRADLVIAVSQADARAHRKMGAPRVVVAANGIAPHIGRSDLAYWRRFKRDNKITRLVGFIGSGHPPNWYGFTEMIGSHANFLPPDTRIILAGGVADHFSEALPKSSPFWQQIIAVGKLSEARLHGLIKESELLLLPITQGGGSNLKTAEAIVSDKKIVATSFAFRGHEQCKALSNIILADSQADFQQAIIQSLNTSQTKRLPAQKRLAQTVTWSYTLKPLNRAIRGMLYRSIIRLAFRRGRHLLGRIKRVF